METYCLRDLIYGMKVCDVRGLNHQPKWLNNLGLTGNRTLTVAMSGHTRHFNQWV